MATWCFDGAALENQLRITLSRFMDCKPVLFGDIDALDCKLQTKIENFQRVVRSLRANQPRGLWDLLSIIRNMMQRQDNNGILLLEIVTRCILDQKEVS